MTLADFRVLTFDCYGTLVDWETGLLNALRPWARRAKLAAGDAELLEAKGEEERAQQAETPSMLYRDLLAEVHRRLAARFGVAARDDEARAFAASIADWPPFPDTPDALRDLKRRCRLVILSNVDRRSFKATNAKLGVAFDAVYTAEDIGSYKPDRRNFQYLIEGVRRDLGLDRSQILHVAQSVFHDIEPAGAIGLKTCWIDRQAAKGRGVTPPPAGPVRWDYRFETLAGFAEAHRRDSGGAGA
jgi:2-haloacid dehalogenase